MKNTVSIIVLLFCSVFSFSQQNKWNESAQPLHRAEKALTDVMVHDVFSPNVASRIYLYTNVAAYEVLAKQVPGYNSLYGQVKNFPQIPAAPVKITGSLAAVYAFLLVGKKLVFSEAMLEDSAKNILKWFYTKMADKKNYKASLAYGKTVADSIIEWSAKDQYRETRRLRRYNYLKQEGKWIPTPPGYMAAIEPYWNKLRCLTLDSASQFKPAPPTAFSKEKNSQFYKEAYEVYEAGRNISNAQKEIANFWDCNPFFLNVEGHVNYAGKKMSPGGHWMSITGIACNKAGKTIMESAEAYALTAIALFDSFISCWDEKYRSNLIRPETYINANIDEGWRPLLQTPPFPEYLSGHSVISTAAALMLTAVLGENFSYEDSSEGEYGIPIRHFDSFNKAAEEAAISRFYGGIHYRPAIINGQDVGRKIGEWVLQKIHLRQQNRF